MESIYPNDRGEKRQDDPLGERILIGKLNEFLRQRVDLVEAFDNGIEPPEELVPDIILSSSVHMFYGKAAHGKTWILLWLIARLLEQGKKVAYFDSENGKRIILERLQGLGVTKTKLPNLYYFPFPALGFDKESVTRYVEFLKGVKPDLVAFDSVANFLGLSSLEESSNEDFIKWCTRYTRPARQRSIAVVLVDHPGWNGDHVRGASRKLDEVDVMWAVKCPVPFDRGRTSTVTLRKEKDREAWLPESVAFNIGGTDEDGNIVCRRTDHAVIEVEGADGLKPKQRIVVDALREEFGARGARDAEWKRQALKRNVSERTYYRAKGTAIARKLVVERDGRFFPGGNPDGSSDGSSEKRIDKRDSRLVPPLPNHCHGDNGSGETSTAITATPFKGGSNDSSADSYGEARLGIAGGDRRYVEDERDSQQGLATLAAREDKDGSEVEPDPGHLSSSSAEPPSGGPSGAASGTLR